MPKHNKTGQTVSLVELPAGRGTSKPPPLRENLLIRPLDQGLVFLAQLLENSCIDGASEAITAMPVRELGNLLSSNLFHNAGTAP